jgi:hypothetical protein
MVGDRADPNYALAEALAKGHGNLLVHATVTYTSTFLIIGRYDCAEVSGLIIASLDG